MFKKTNLLAALFLTVLVCFAGCGKTPDNKEEKIPFTAGWYAYTTNVEGYTQTTYFYFDYSRYMKRAGSKSQEYKGESLESLRTQYDYDKLWKFAAESSTVTLEKCEAPLWSMDFEPGWYLSVMDNYFYFFDSSGKTIEYGLERKETIPEQFDSFAKVFEANKTSIRSDLRRISSMYDTDFIRLPSEPSWAFDASFEPGWYRIESAEEKRNSKNFIYYETVSVNYVFVNEDAYIIRLGDETTEGESISIPRFYDKADFQNPKQKSFYRGDSYNTMLGLMIENTWRHSSSKEYADRVEMFKIADAPSWAFEADDDELDEVFIARMLLGTWEIYDSGNLFQITFNQDGSGEFDFSFTEGSFRWKLVSAEGSEAHVRIYNTNGYLVEKAYTVTFHGNFSEISIPDLYKGENFVKYN